MVVPTGKFDKSLSLPGWDALAGPNIKKETRTTNKAINNLDFMFSSWNGCDVWHKHDGYSK
jgi:hypothetical protein